MWHRRNREATLLVKRPLCLKWSLIGGINKKKLLTQLPFPVRRKSYQICPQKDHNFIRCYRNSFKFNKKSFLMFADSSRKSILGESSAAPSIPLRSDDFLPLLLWFWEYVICDYYSIMLMNIWSNFHDL